MPDLSEYLFTTRTIKGILQPRKFHKGCPLKEELIPLIGKEYEFEVMWVQEEGIYEGEYALREVSGEIREAGIGWIASGDIILMIDNS